MITQLNHQHIPAIARTQRLAWQVGFRRILSDEVLAGLQDRDFEENWRSVLQQPDRQNLVWCDADAVARGFVSYGPPKDRTDPADTEIYGIYLHPEYWGQGIGHQLLDRAMTNFREDHPTARVIIWTMRDNDCSQALFQRYGFRESRERRWSQRYGDRFEEVQFNHTDTKSTKFH